MEIAAQQQRVLSGYKQTEVGVIPEDWGVCKLSELFDFKNGVNADKNAYGEGIQFINVLEVINHSHIHSSEIPGRVRLRKVTQESYSVQRGDILFNRTSETQEEVGLAAVYDDDDVVVFGGFVIRGRPKTTKFDQRFTGYALRSPAVRRQIMARGQGAIRANIGQADLKQVQMAVPKLSEQRAIAAALSDADELIGVLGNLIAKKHDLKQAAMQQLLTDQTRLPGFSGKWEMKRLGDITDITKLAGFEYTNYFNSYKDGGEVIVMRGTNITNNKLDLSDTRTIPRVTSNKLPRSKLYKDDLVFAYVGTIGPVFLIDQNDKYHLGPNTCKITAGDCISPEFLFSYFCSWLAQKEIIEHTSIGAQPSLSMTKIRKFNLLVPPTKSEQTAIATVFSDMDAEIAALESRRDKTRALKQGMMQELLTGKTRLI